MEKSGNHQQGGDNLGKHLILDYYCESKEMNDKKSIYKFLRRLVNIIKMKRLTEPIVKQGKPYLAGVSGFIMIETSHCSIHTFTKENRLNMDIYSCKDFDEDKVIEHLNNTFSSLKLLKGEVIQRDDGQVIEVII